MRALWLGCYIPQIPEAKAMREHIEVVENTNIMVFVDPQKLRDIADGLDRQQERYNLYLDGKIGPYPECLNLDSIHCQLNSGSISIWFRLPCQNHP